MSRSRSNDGSGSVSVERSEKKSRRSKKVSKRSKRSLDRKSTSRSRSRSRRRSPSPKKRNSRSKSRDRGKYSDDQNTSDDSRAGSPAKKRRRGRRGRKSKKSRKNDKYKNDANSEDEAPPKDDEAEQYGLGEGPMWTAPRGRGMGRGGGRWPGAEFPRGRGRGRGLRGRGYYRPNYIAIGRNIFPGGTSDEDSSSSSSSRSRSGRRRRSRRHKSRKSRRGRRRRRKSYSSSSSRSTTPEDMKNTPEHMKGRSPTPEPPKEIGLLDKLRLKEDQEDVSHDRVQEIMQQLASGATEIRRGQFVQSFSNQDMFENNETPILRKEMKETSAQPSFPQIRSGPPQPRLFEDLPAHLLDPNVDRGMGLRKQMQEAENQERQKTLEESIQKQAEMDKRIKSRVVAQNPEEVIAAQMKAEKLASSFLARKRSAANIRAAVPEKKDDEPPKLASLPPLKTETIDDDAEFLKNLNKQFNSERGMKIMPITSKMSFAQISSNASTKGKLKIGGSKGLVSKFQAPKILGVKPRVPTSSTETQDIPQSSEQISPPIQPENASQETLFSSDILSTAPLLDKNIGPKRPVMKPKPTARRATSGIVLPSTILSQVKSQPVENTPRFESHVPKATSPAPTSLFPIKTEPTVYSSPKLNAGSSGFKIAPPTSNMPTSIPSMSSIASIKTETIDQVNNTLEAPKTPIDRPPPPVIRRDVSAPAVLPSSSKPAFEFNQNKAPLEIDFSKPPPGFSLPPPSFRPGPPFSTSVPPPTLPPSAPPAVPPLMPSGSASQPQIYSSSGPPPGFPPMLSMSRSEPEIVQEKKETYNDVYIMYPSVWLGFVGLKSKAAMIQLHHIGGNQHISSRLLMKNLVHPSSDGSKHPIMKIKTRVKLDGKAVETIKRKWNDIPYKCCTMLALPYGVDPDDTEKQKQCLEKNFSKYFADKNCCGNLSITHEDQEWQIFIFPPCQFMDTSLEEKASDLKAAVENLPKLMITITPK